MIIAVVMADEVMIFVFRRSSYSELDIALVAPGSEEECRNSFC